MASPLANTASLHELAMLGDSAGHAFTLKTEAAWLQRSAHHTNDLILWLAGRFLDFLESGAVLPCHTNNLIS